MKGFKFAVLMVLSLSLLCFCTTPVLADDGIANGQTNDQNSQATFTAVEDPGGTNSKGIPSHDDDWSRKDKPNNGNWGSGNHPGEANGGPGAQAIWTIVQALSVL